VEHGFKRFLRNELRGDQLESVGLLAPANRFRAADPCAHIGPGDAEKGRPRAGSGSETPPACDSRAKVADRKPIRKGADRAAGARLPELRAASRLRRVRLNGVRLRTNCLGDYGNLTQLVKRGATAAIPRRGSSSLRAPGRTTRSGTGILPGSRRRTRSCRRSDRGIGTASEPTGPKNNRGAISRGSGVGSEAGDHSLTARTRREEFQRISQPAAMAVPPLRRPSTATGIELLAVVPSPSWPPLL
jgi:hypothetical protein